MSFLKRLFGKAEGEPKQVSESGRESSQAKGRIPYVLIPAGPFLMGNDYGSEFAYRSEGPQRTVTLSEYTIGKYPVTVGEYREFMDAGGYLHRQYWTDEGWEWREKEGIKEPKNWHEPIWTGDDRLPVAGVSWHEASAYCQWLSELRGHPVRLPTAAEWEKAARGTDGRIWPWGNEARPARGNVGEGPFSHTTPVGQLSPSSDSPYGCADMAGNVHEWCADWYDESYYQHAPTENPLGPEDGTSRELRGGSWQDYLPSCRTSMRFNSQPSSRWDTYGFRVVVEIPNLNALKA
jgi:formylglycine-generating enzyme required for sulfatase activity